MPKRAIFERKKGFLEEKSKMIRKETLRLTDICGSGHYGSAFSIVELLVILYYKLLPLAHFLEKKSQKDSHNHIHS